MNIRIGISSFFMSVIVFGATASLAHAQTSMNLSAANCIPRTAGAFDQSGSDGFHWHDTGATLNKDDDEAEDLICAVPYDPTLRRADGTIPRVEVSVDVIDGHTGKIVRATLFGQNGNVSATALGAAGTTTLDAGRRTLAMTITPGTTLRYLWLRINVPDSEGGVESGIVGYRIRRY